MTASQLARAIEHQSSLISGIESRIKELEEEKMKHQQAKCSLECALRRQDYEEDEA